MASLPPYVQAIGHGIHVIDTGFQRPQFDAAYLVVENGRAAFVDTGTNHALGRLLGTLEALGLARDAVDAVIPTHVHLDHAGGAGALMRELPAAVLWAGQPVVYVFKSREMIVRRTGWGLNGVDLQVK